MNEPSFLILHKVRGAPAFDIAHQMACPECAEEGCTECDQKGYWWIISTSGHRAYPYCYWDMEDLHDLSDIDMPRPVHVMELNTPLPDDLPDHYRQPPTRRGPIPSILSALGLGAKPLQRRKL